MRTFVFYVFVVFAAAISFSPVAAQKKDNSVAQKQPAEKNTALKPPAQTSNVSFPAAAIEQAVLDEINAARKDPKKYAQYLEDYKKLFKGSILYLPGYTRIQTNEGTTAVDEAISYLKTASELGPYSLSGGLYKAASLQLKDLMQDSSLLHTGKDGSTLPQRLARFGTVNGKAAENISLFSDTARDIVLSMIIDDGIKSRSHRKNIFSPSYKVVGIAYGKGKTGEGLCIIDFADSFSEGSPKPVARPF